jgi:hypothetical protein
MMRRFLRRLWLELRRGYQYESGYHHALDDVWDHALDQYNPCHDRIREWIVKRRTEMSLTVR